MLPNFIDKETGYRYYEANKLLDLAKFIFFRQIGLSINEIKELSKGCGYTDILKKRKSDIQNELIVYSNQLTKINYLLEGNFMNYEVITKELPEYSIYYKQGIPNETIKFEKLRPVNAVCIYCKGS